MSLTQEEIVFVSSLTGEGKSFLENRVVAVMQDEIQS